MPVHVKSPPRRQARLPGLPLGLLFLVLAAACGGEGGGGAPVRFPDVYANRVVASAVINSTGASDAEWPFFFQPAAVLGPPGGVLDVLSLGYDAAATGSQGGSVTVGLGDHTDPAHRLCAVDGAGPDLAVFENPFHTTDAASGISGTNNEVATVEVSQDNGTWYAFAWNSNGALHPVERARYAGLAGVTPSDEGGDVFDLAGLIADNGLPAGFMACYVRIRDGGLAIADYGNTQTDLYRSGADIDAVGAFYTTPAPGLTP